MPQEAIAGRAASLHCGSLTDRRVSLQSSDTFCVRIMNLMVLR